MAKILTDLFLTTCMFGILAAVYGMLQESGKLDEPLSSLSSQDIAVLLILGALFVASLIGCFVYARRTWYDIVGE